MTARTLALTATPAQHSCEESAKERSNGYTREQSVYFGSASSRQRDAASDVLDDGFSKRTVSSIFDMVEAIT